MPITKTPMMLVGGCNVADHARAEQLHVGRVAEVRKRMARRNCSDTLDYTDFRVVEVTEALVYRGLTWRGSFGFDSQESPCPVEERFHWVDCTSLFTWRGSDSLSPEADPRAAWPTGMAEDLTLWQEAQERAAREKELRQQENERLARERAEQEERNRPVRGKKMVVVSGQKVLVGTVGTVAHVMDGRVLLKGDNEWRDRNANGVWVAARHLRSR